MKKVYLISGLGADKRVFDCLDLSAYHVQHIEWIKPNKGETLQSYVKRLTAQITEENPTLMGVSFGGIVATEIAKIIPVQKVILISSARVSSEIPVQQKWFGRIGLINIIPSRFFNKVNNQMYWFFGVETESDKQLLKAIVEDTDPDFMKWGIDKIFKWENEIPAPNSFVIQGTNDRLFPLTKADFPIDGGGHLMIVSKCDQVMRCINLIMDGQ